ncbi:endonuclease domain-containing protein [Sphaerisporangium sp. NBC_01403]
MRGLLCSNCNTMVGLAKDNPERLESAALYLRQSGAKVP